MKKYANTSDITVDGIRYVKLHDTIIAEVNKTGEEVQLNSGGWHTPTTKKRINELLEDIGSQWRLTPIAGAWWLYSQVTGDRALFVDGIILRS